ncbi:MAG TPA: pyridoxal-phosphate dependent enzyme [Xanthomonadaceae bacterium]|nr:pyridoxal-phosphate dependent enzyme [Xanthomonadaceae bacterium]
MSEAPIPQLEDVRDAAARIAPYAQVTPLRESGSIDARAGARLRFKCENLQRTGAFKFRGACNAVFALPQAQARAGVVTHSSGNHGAALALAAQLRGIPAHVVVPEGAVPAKLAAIAAFGATVHRCEPTLAARESVTAEVQARTGATLVHPYADVRVIAGQGTATLELLAQADGLDAVIAPIGGGGLIGGTATVLRALAPRVEIFAAEPEGAADALASLQAGHRITDIVPDTVCDGLRAAIGAVNFELLRRHAVTVLPVDDAEVIAAMRLMWERLKLLVEPSGATVLAAVLRHRTHFAGRRVGLIVSGGNVDLASACGLFATAAAAQARLRPE